ncbi:alpha/beta hydrolase [Micromonospora sp. KC721]|uniref:alpha/beta hydrolase n=1 Tax=Micromonospora sp. KC721 TaxID=2530380 RepID=UPI001404CA75|nr:alpha/beta hydrolase [Micromonospora sp. KC721]
MTMDITMQSTRARRRWPFGVAAAVWIVVAAAALLGLVLPAAPGPVLLGLAISAYSFNLYLLVPALTGGLLAWWARRVGRRRWAGVAGILTVLLMLGVAVPSWQLWHSAAAHNVPLSLTAYFSGPSGGASAPATTETYATVDGVELKADVWQPTGRPAGGSRTAMIYVFGGGWVSGDRAQMPAYFQWLTSRGVTVFAVDYRLATPTRPAWDKAPGDVKCAVGWVRANATRHGIDPHRIVLGGNSAGANLAMLVAYTAGDTRVPATCPTGDTSVRAVVEFYGPTDLITTHRDTGSTDARRMVETYLGGTPATVPERYRRNSPVTYVRPGLPPTLILQGGRDSVVPAAQATDLADRLTAVGVPNELVMLPATEHSFDGLYGGFATQVSRSAITRFLDRHLA